MVVLRKKCNVFFLFFAILSCIAQNSIEGVVLDQNSNPISEVSITIIELKNVGVMSDFDGKFEISVPQGSYTLETSFVGFRTKRVLINAKTPEKVFVTITLQENIEELTDVIITGKTQAQNIREKAFEVEVVETKNLKNLSVDINSVLNTIPGVVVRESGGLGSRFNFSLHGFSENQVRFFIDGIPQDNLGTSLTFNNFPATLIERAEVYKGVVPIYLGADALGGAINIVTNQSKKTFLDVSYDSGSFNTHRATLNGNYHNKNGFVARVVSFFNYSDNDYTINQVDPREKGIVIRDENGNRTGEILDSAERFHDAYQSQMVQARIGLVDKTYADELFIGATIASNDNEIQHGILAVNPFGDVRTKENVTLGSLVYKKNRILRMPIKLKIYGELAKIQSKQIDTFSNNYNWSGEVLERNDQTRGELGGAKTLFTFDDQRHIINTSIAYVPNNSNTLHFNYTKNHLKRQGSDPFSIFKSPFEDPHHIDKNILGLSYEVETFKERWETTVFSKLFLTTVKGIIEDEFDSNAATRFTAYKNTSQEWGYGIASSFDINNEIKAKISYEKTFRIPEGTELFGDGLLLSSNPFLEPEQSANVNVGFLWKSKASNLQLDVDMNSFYRGTKNLFFLSPEGVKARYINLAETRNVGFEGEISISHKERFYVIANATYQYITDAVRDIRVPNQPYFFGNFRTGYTFQNLFSFQGKLTISWNSLFTEEFPFQSFNDGNTNDRLRIPQQFSHNLQLGYSLDDRYHISLQVRNLTDASVFDNIAVQKQGRAFFVKLRYFFSQNKSKI